MKKVFYLVHNTCMGVYELFTVDRNRKVFVKDTFDDALDAVRYASDKGGSVKMASVYYARQAA